ncbi:putative MFS family arabinose efflux permease [Trueperella bonasi]|uniref:MFS family arabinose efflux permease n=1 Tax=Trueperella bonasi TaxID=312286 RepID=A0ABT9NFQ8_9ACTO|nr:MFS transporter [Trueperella bonasi]MDP9806224.1 putative MFS family arabinose efflux permease [Trueperella bonasi]
MNREVGKSRERGGPVDDRGQSSPPKAKNPPVEVSMFVLVCMASVTMMAILSELVPSGILPELMAGLNISEAQAGNLVGFYAIASAISAIPLIALTQPLRRKRLLLILLIGFAASNFVVGIASNYGMAVAGRIVGGICAGVLWPMIAAYAMKLVKPENGGRAIAIVMAGTTVGMSIGVPVMTWVGRTFGWRIEFHTLAVMTIIIALLMIFFVPDAPGETHAKENSVFTIIRNRGVLLLVFLTLLAVVGNYAIYVYITNLVSTTNFGPGGKLWLAQLLFGVGCFISVWAAAKFSDLHLRALMTTMLGLGALAFLAFVVFKGMIIVAHLAFVVWGFGFGALVSVFQAGTTRQVRSGKAVATSIQSSTFNLSIMIASSMGGAILDRSSIYVLLVVCAIMLAVAAVMTFGSKKTFAPEVIAE